MGIKISFVRGVKVENPLNYNNLSIEDQIKLVKEDGCNIQFISSPCLEVQLEAVKEYKYCIQYINTPCLEVQLELINNCYFKWSLNTIKKYITNKDALEYWKLKYILLEE